MNPSPANANANEKLDPRRVWLIWTILIFALLGISAMYAWKSLRKSALPIYGDLPRFQLIERSGRTVTNQDLKGKVWIADFIFTRCAGPCPIMTASMSRLQRELQTTPDIQLVSFSVDPEFDTPEVLTRYAMRYQASTHQWFFLTGKTEVIRAIAQGFKVTMAKATGSDAANADPNAILHDTHFMLVDQRGRIRGYYESPEDGKPSPLLIDAQTLLKEK